ncbi:Stress responsive alpha-beta barrel [Phaffia rhodozyma]|uniref:Stress responsive alpha-beta barrel n=1 Tax=Phaffia rhodozyma TaxID=264483 RepID=A0A0F7SEJ0_PHARH|nr:Stress responsive alpha-beta barrel [Phaffia rhodozyma]
MGKIIHIVLWKLAPPPSSITAVADIAAHQAQVKARFQKLLTVPGVLEGYVGEPKIADRAKGFDWGFYAVFESMDALKKYAVSDAHMKIVIEDVRPNTQDVLAYDFELP